MENENKPIPENTKKQNNKLSLSIKILLIILIILVLLSLGILLIRLGDLLPNNTDIFFIEPKEGDVEFSDEKEIWDLDTKIDIFSISKENEDGQIIVESSDGSKVIAPGMEGTYRFQINNKGNIAVDAKTQLDISFIVENLEFENLPIEVKFSNYKGENLNGGGWIIVDKFNQCVDELVIGKNSYVYYQLDWRWAFELGNDEFDTLLGNLSVNSVVKMTVGIQATATQSDDYDAEGGLVSGIDAGRTGGSIVPVPYILLNLLILIIIAVLITLESLKRKKQSEEIQNIVDETKVDEVL